MFQRFNDTFKYGVNFKAKVKFKVKYEIKWNKQIQRIYVPRHYCLLFKWEKMTVNKLYFKNT